MRPLSILAVARALAVLAGAGAGCGGKAATHGNPDGSAGVDAAPLPTPTPGGWTWVDVPGMQCDDGSGTGVAVNPAPGASAGGGALFIYFMGGGACWDATTCFVLNTAVHGPFGQAQWDANAAGVTHALDRARATNPFRDASYVFVPYCTGDLHGGSNVATYDVLGPRAYAHVGRRSVEALLPRLRATWPSPARVVIAGSSAGGFGATLNYDLIRSAYAGAEAALVDDAGPLLEGDGIPVDERSAWYTNWHLGDVVAPLCGADCGDDLSRIYPALVAKHPQDRMALLTSLQDQTIRTYFKILLGPDFELRLRALITDRLAPTATFRTFAIPGESHTLLGNIDTVSSGGVALEAWLGAMLAGDATWASVGL